VKKCPECGNPSYDGAPVCGNCGYKFPKPKSIAPKIEDIFLQEPEIKEENDEQDTVSIIKENKLIIGIILAITLIVICGIVLSSSLNTNSTDGSNSVLENPDEIIKYDDGKFTFKYPKSWKKIDGSDPEHPGAVFFQNKDKVIIEYYNISTSAKSLIDITQQRISYAQAHGDYVELVETITLDGRNSSNILLENANGDYTRYVSMFSEGKLYVFKISGDAENSLTSQDIENTIKTADIA